MKRIVPVLLSLFLFGCSVVTLDLTQLEVSDGISQEEAVLIAQMRLSDSDLRHSRKFKSPVVLDTAETASYPDYWFIQFPSKYPFGDASYRYLSVVDKSTGDIKFSGRWYFKKNPDFAWIFKNYKE